MFSRNSKSKWLVALACSAALVTTSAHANVGDEMRDFFEGGGGYVNTTGPTSFEGQSAGYYSGGSLWARTPISVVNPVNIQLPRASGGCGGIDLFTGSFSFINTDQIVSTLKATANNAIGFAFQLAIDSISAEIGGVMKDMAAKVQSINEFNMSSCEEAQALVGGIFPQIEGASSTICQTVGVGEGFFSDVARSRHGCTTGGERDSTLSRSNDPRVDLVTPRNYTWHALRSAGMDVDYAEFLMSLIGAPIYWRPQGAGDDQPGEWRVEHVDHESLLTQLLNGQAASDAIVLDCGGSTAADGCLEPTRRVLTVSAQNSFIEMTNSIVSSVQDKIATGQRLSSNEVAFINATAIPIFKILVVNESAVSSGLSDSEVRYLSEAVAIDMLIRFIRGAVNDADQAISASSVPANEQISQWRDSATRLRSLLADKERELQARANLAAQILDRTLRLEATLKNQMTANISGSLSLAASLGAGSRF